MSELTIEQLIKIIIGVFVVIAVVVGLVFIFKDRLFSFIKNMPSNATAIKFILGIL